MVVGGLIEKYLDGSRIKRCITLVVEGEELAAQEDAPAELFKNHSAFICFPFWRGEGRGAPQFVEFFSK